jgi:parallel beta-helix repeat protein
MAQYLLKRSKNDQSIVFQRDAKRVGTHPLGVLLAVGNGDGTVSIKNEGKSIDGIDFFELSNIPFAEYRVRDLQAGGTYAAQRQVGSDEAETVSELNELLGNNISNNPDETLARLSGDLIVDAARGSDTTGNGTVSKPYATIGAAYAASASGQTIAICAGTYTETIIADGSKSIRFIGMDRELVIWQAAASFSDTNDSCFETTGTSSTNEFHFTGISFKKGCFAVKIMSASKVLINNCVFYHNGWSGSRLSLSAAQTDTWANEGTLGYDSSASDLQSFAASSEVMSTEGGAIFIENSTEVEITDNDIHHCRSGIYLLDCGENGFGNISRNQIHTCILSAIHLNSSSLTATDGCSNFNIYNNSASLTGDNGIFVCGGIDNIVALNVIKNNWNAGCMAADASNTRFRDMDLSDNNRAATNAMGETGHAEGSIVIKGSTLRSDADFICEILDTQIYNTGLGSSSEKVGIYIDDGLDAINDRSRALINIDDVGFKSQDYAIKAECDLDEIKLTLGDLRFIDTVEKNIVATNGKYYELPFSNHHTNINVIDFKLDDTNSQIQVREGHNGNVINTYPINSLQAVAFGTKIRVILKGSDKIQFDDIPVSGCSIGGVAVNSVLATAVNTLNGIFTNTSGFSTTGVTVTGGSVTGNDLTLNMSDSSSITIDVTSLAVDTDNEVSSGAVSGTDLVLTMSDASTVTIDVANLVNGATVNLANPNWFYLNGPDAGDAVPDTSSAEQSKAPFYFGEALYPGEEIAWTPNYDSDTRFGIWQGGTLYGWSNINNTHYSKSMYYDESHNNLPSGKSYGWDWTESQGNSFANGDSIILRYDTDNFLKLFKVHRYTGQEDLRAVGSVAEDGTARTIVCHMADDNADLQLFTHRATTPKPFYVRTGIISTRGDQHLNSTFQLNDYQPLDYGPLLEKGQELVWQHSSSLTASNTMAVGVYGTDLTEGTSNARKAQYWVRSVAIESGRVRADGGATYDGTGFDINTRYASGYTVTSNTIFALRYASDNKLKLYDITDEGQILITEANVAEDGNPVQITFAAHHSETVPSITKREAEWEIVHEDSTGHEGDWYDGIKPRTVIKSRLEINPGEKLSFTWAPHTNTSNFGLDWLGNATGHTGGINTKTLWEAGLLKTSSSTDNEFRSINNSQPDWNMNTNNQYYDDSSGTILWSKPRATMNLEIRYFANYSVQLLDVDTGEVIATIAQSLTGSPFRFCIGSNHGLAASEIPTNLTKASLSSSPSPSLLTHAPDISNQTLNAVENSTINFTPSLDTSSNKVTMWAFENLPSWLVADESTGQITGTAPAYAGTAGSGVNDEYYVTVKVGNPFGIDTCTLTVSIAELLLNTTYTKCIDNDNTNEWLQQVTNSLSQNPLRRNANGTGSSDAWTVSILQEFTGDTTGGYLFAQGDSATGVGVRLFTNGNGNLSFRYGNSTYKLWQSWNNGTLSTGNDVFHLITITYDGGTTGSDSAYLSDYFGRFNFYLTDLDTKQTSQITPDSQNHNNDGVNQAIYGRLTVGGNYNNNYIMGGKVAAMSITNSALTLSEIQGDSTTGENGFALDPLGWKTENSITDPDQHKIWLMGDGVDDNDNGDLYIRNQVDTTDNGSMLQMKNMTSDRIVNHTPTGLQ